METPPFAPNEISNSELTGVNGQASRRSFLKASGAAIASAFLPASALSMLAAAPALARPTRQALLPAIPDFGKNPYAQGAITRLTALLDAEKEKQFAGFSRSTSAQAVGEAATDTLELIRAYNYDESPLKGNADCLKAIIARCDCLYPYAKAVRGGEDYLFLPQISEILLMLTELTSMKVDQARLDQWKGMLEAVMTPIFAANTEHLVVTALAKVWTNVDVRYIAALTYSGTVLITSKFRNLALGGGMRLMDKVLEPDGGVNYSDEQNDCFAYHPVYVTTLARLFQITGEKVAGDLVAATQWYIPVSTGAYGAAEYYTAPSWKQVWDDTTGADAAAIVFDITGNQYNAGHLKQFPPPASLFLASFYKQDQVPQSMPEKYIFYDQNIKGPRGRNGNFSFAATGRTTLGSNRGKVTFVGCMVVDDPKKLPAAAGGFAVNAALTSAGMEITTSPKVDYNQSTPSELVYLVQRETVAATANPAVGALSTHHRLSAYKHSASDWFVTECWLLTPERMVGLLDLHALSDQLGCSIKGVLKFVSGCGERGVARKFEKVDDSKVGQGDKQDGEAATLPVAYTYGGLTARIIEHNFAEITTSYVNTFNDTARKAGRLVLSSQSAGMKMYPLGTNQFYLVEVHPSRFAPAKSIRRITDLSGIIGLELVEQNGLKYKLLVNDTSGIVDLKEAYNDVRADAQVHNSGDHYRLDFLPTLAAKLQKPGGRIAELASLTNFLDMEGVNAGVKEDDEADNKVTLRPYRHKIIISGVK